MISGANKPKRKIRDPLILPPSTSTKSKRNGGGKRDRTDDLLLAKQALSQLSYTPELINSITR